MYSPITDLLTLSVVWQVLYHKVAISGGDPVYGNVSDISIRALDLFDRMSVVFSETTDLSARCEILLSMYTLLYGASPVFDGKRWARCREYSESLLAELHHPACTLPSDEREYRLCRLRLDAACPEDPDEDLQDVETVLTRWATDWNNPDTTADIRVYRLELLCQYAAMYGAPWTEAELNMMYADCLFRRPEMGEWGRLALVRLRESFFMS